MKKPSPIILIALLLIAAILVTPQPPVRVLLFLLLIGSVAVSIGRHLAPWVRRGPAPRWPWKPVFWGTSAAVLLASAGLLLATRPTLVLRYVPNDAAAGSGRVVEQRGFYATEHDTAGNAYVWTQERATLVYDFLVHRPITLTVRMRSAAVAGGPATPVTVEANGHVVGTLAPDPANPAFQAISVRFVPPDWGGERTQIRLLPQQTFAPGKGDTRQLGTMVQEITIDRSEAWRGVERRIWLVWLIPCGALGALGLLLASRRFSSSLAGYGAIACCGAGALCAAVLALILLRIGFIEPTTYYAWLSIATADFVLFLAVALTLPFGAWETMSIARRLHDRAGARATRIVRNARTWVRNAWSPDRDATPASRRARATDLLLLFTIAFGVRLLWVVLVPPWQAPDEPAHFAYIQQIVEQARTPHAPYPPYPPYSDEIITSWEPSFFQTISNIGAAGTQPLAHLPVEHSYAAIRDYRAPHEERRSAAAGTASPHPPLYYLIASIPYAIARDAPLLSRLYAARAASAVLGALTCVFAYLFAWEIRRSRHWGWALGLCVAFMPMYVFMSASVNNDIGMDAASAALIWLTVRVWRREELSPRLAAAVGVACGLTLLTKATAASLVGIAAIAMLAKVGGRCFRAPSRIKRQLAALGLLAAVTGLVYSPWVALQYHYTRQIRLVPLMLTALVRFISGTVTASAAPADTLVVLAQSHSLWHYIQFEYHRGWPYFQDLLIRNFWGNFGWLDAPLAANVYTPITIVLLIGIIGLTLQIILQPPSRSTTFLLVAIVLVHAIFLFVAVDWYFSYRKSGQLFGLQGRYFFPVLIPFLYCVLSGWEYLCGENRAALRVAPVAMLLLQAIAVATIAARYYGVVIG
jgi:hypothetical protein